MKKRGRLSKELVAKREEYLKVDYKRRAVLLQRWGYKSQQEFFDAVRHTPKRPPRIPADAPAIITGKKRGPGRPRKTAVLEEAGTVAGKATTGKKGPGRPRKTKEPKIDMIHNVHILDRSGSMWGNKLSNAVQGINSEIGELKKDKKMKYHQTIVSFDNTIKTNYNKVPISKVKNFSVSAGGSTALFQAIGETLDAIEKKAKSNEKTIVKVFTDGQENDSRGKYANEETIAKRIKDAEAKGITVAFVGTKHDVDYAVSRLNIDISNTMIHDNTAKGVKKIMDANIGATMSFAADASAGKDVSRGFYKKTGKL